MIPDRLSSWQAREPAAAGPVRLQDLRSVRRATFEQGRRA